MKSQTLSPINYYRIQGILKSSIKNYDQLAKKKIADYSYYPCDLIGTGFSSNVYIANKKDDQTMLYAIKVIRLANISHGHYQLLQNEIQILKQLNHPNIIKFHDVYYTRNNCYIITDYCEGGTLQNHLQSKCEINWQEICQQMVDACKYLGEKLVIHRDIKPANIFRRNGVWKLGDFGFARFIPHRTSYVNQTFRVGSPLYMPPQTLEKSIYSLKTDSFALGILLFNLTTKEFPWVGNNRRQLLDNYGHKEYPKHKIKHLPENIQQFLIGLCQIQISRRLFISEYDSIVSKALEQDTIETCSQISLDRPQESPLTLRLEMSNTKKFKLCRFLSLIDINIQHFTEMCELSQLIRRNIKYFLIVFGWHQNSPQAKYMEDFRCKNYQQFQYKRQLQEVLWVIQEQINATFESSIPRIQVLRSKLQEYSEIIECLLQQNIQLLVLKADNLILHPDFSRVAPRSYPTLPKQS